MFRFPGLFVCQGYWGFNLWLCEAFQYLITMNQRFDWTRFVIKKGLKQPELRVIGTWLLLKFTSKLHVLICFCLQNTLKAI